MLRTARPEVELLVRCAQTELDAETAGRIRSLAEQDLDWEYLLTLARQHGVTPLLHKQLTTITESALPAAPRERLRNAFRRNTEHNLYRTSELHRLIDRFDDRDIRVIPIKGPVLAETAYGSVSLREFRDLDLLVSKQDVSKATALLRAQGYTINKPDHPDTLEEIVSGRTVVQPPLEFDFYRTRDASEVDLRWQLGQSIRPLDLSFDSLWKRRQRAELAGTPVQTLSPEDRLIVLASHGAGHSWARLEWVCDVAEMLRADEDIEWRRVLNRARELGREKDVLLGLVLAVTLQHVEAPGNVLRRARAAPAVMSLASRIVKRFITNPTFKSDPLSGFLFTIRMGNGLVDRLSVLSSAILKPKIVDYGALPLPRPLHPLYYGIRPLRLAGTYGLQIPRRWVSDRRSKAPTA